MYYSKIILILNTLSLMMVQRTRPKKSSKSMMVKLFGSRTKILDKRPQLTKVGVYPKDRSSPTSIQMTPISFPMLSEKVWNSCWLILMWRWSMGMRTKLMSLVKLLSITAPPTAILLLWSKIGFERSIGRSYSLQHLSGAKSWMRSAISIHRFTMLWI